jgi:hypothetical protein
MINAFWCWSTLRWIYNVFYYVRIHTWGSCQSRCGIVLYEGTARASLV